MEICIELDEDEKITVLLLAGGILYMFFGMLISIGSYLLALAMGILGLYWAWELKIEINTQKKKRDEEIYALFTEKQDLIYKKSKLKRNKFKKLSQKRS